MNLAATLANTAWLAASLPAHAHFRRSLRNPSNAQAQRLRHLLAHHANTVYGRRHAFASIKTYEEFTYRVPPITYDGLVPWITRIQSGEPNVLTREPVTHLIPTSGSTSARKLIPFTAALQTEFNAAIGPWIVDLFMRNPSLTGGPAYWSISPLDREHTPSPSVVPIGFADDSDYLGGTRARIVESILAAPSALRHLNNLDHFRYVTLLCLVRQPDLRLISVWHPSFLSLLLDSLSGLWTALLADIRNGTCRYSTEIPQSVRTVLHCRPDPARAAQLSRADPCAPLTLWPALRVVSCWTDAYAVHALASLRPRLPGITFQPKGLLATEAFVTIPFGNAHPLAVCSHFFEFITDGGRFVRAHELRLGETYEVVVTTAGGLWRYCLGDRVVVTGFVGQTPSLRFLGRTGNGTDLCGEKITEEFAAQVITLVTATLSAPARFALLAPSPAAIPPCYTFYLEADADTSIAKRLDIALRANPHYALCRDLGQLGPVQFFPIASRGYEQFTAAERSRGARLGEIKPVALSRHTDWSQHFTAFAP